MTEKYSFVVSDGSAISEIDLSSIQGCFIREVTDTSAVSWNIATSKNPYLNGVQYNNRSANPREITISFGYDLSVDPDTVDNTIFNALRAVINMREFQNNTSILRLKKTKGSVIKYIDCVIQSIEHVVYTDEPTLQIVLMAAPYWRGAGISDAKYLSQGANYFGSLQPGKAGANLVLTIETTANSSIEQSIEITIHCFTNNYSEWKDVKLTLPCYTDCKADYILNTQKKTFKIKKYGDYNATYEGIQYVEGPIMDIPANATSIQITVGSFTSSAQNFLRGRIGYYPLDIR